jgi:hypothetical protein
MDVTNLIKHASEKSLTKQVIEQVCSDNSLDTFGLYDEFAKEIVREYLDGSYSWAYCDAAMNNLFEYAYGKSESSAGLPEYAYSVFIAFDEGEYEHRDGPPELNGEARTKLLVNKLIGTN